MPYTKTSVTFSELSKEDQKDYFENNPEKFAPDYGWWDCTIEDIKTALEMIGFSAVSVYFSGFCSQGDGAQFVGNYNYQKGAYSVVKKEFPHWTELHTLAEELQEVERKNFYAIGFSISHSGRYSHELCTSFDFTDSRTYWGYVSESFDENAIKEPCRDFMQHIYTLLEIEYDYLRSWGYVSEFADSFDFIEIEVEEE